MIIRIYFYQLQSHIYMNFLKNTLTSLSTLKKTAMHWINPNENPTQFDRYAFNLLDKAEVDLFIEFMELNNVNINVVDYNKASLLMKAQGIPTFTNQHTKLLSEEELQRRAIKAIEYLVKRGVDVNYRGKHGQTALLSASHWGYYQIVQVLLKHGADPNLGSEVQGFCTNPLLSAIFKGHKNIVRLLIIYGADPNITEQYSNKTTGFRLQKKDLDFLYTTYNIYLLSYRRKIEQIKDKNTVLARISQNLFNQICMNI